MNEADIRYLLKSIQVDLTRVSYTGGRNTTRWMNIRCPFAPWRHQGGHDNNPSFGITIKADGRSAFKCFSCGSKGSIAKLPSQLGALRKRDYAKQRHWAEMQELQASSSRPLPSWEDADPVEEQNADKSNPRTRPVSAGRTGYGRALGHSYLRARGISWHAALLCDLRFDQQEQRILFPCYDRDENFVGFTGRSVREGNSRTRGKDPKVKDYLGLPKRETFLRLPLSTGRRGPRILVEGLFDFARLVGFGYRNTHAILGTALTDEKLDILITEAAPVFFLMDNDLAGWQALFGTHDDTGKHETSQAWAYRLYKEIPVWIVPYQKRFDGTDPGSLSVEQVSHMLSKAWLFTGIAPVIIEHKRDGTAVVTRRWTMPR